MSHKITGKKKN